MRLLIAISPQLPQPARNHRNLNGLGVMLLLIKTILNGSGCGREGSLQARRK